jgi:paraquat-inducible protein A
MMEQHSSNANDSPLTGRWIACEQCDLLQREVALPQRSDAHCPRCHAVLYRGSHAKLDTLVALALGCAILFLLTNLFPIAYLSAQGAHVSTTLLGSALVLYAQQREVVALLVFMTTILVPALELAALLYLLLPLRFGRTSARTPTAFRILLASQPWGMLEVLLLGLLVTLVKLDELASVVPGMAFWAFCGFIVLFSWLSASFSSRDFWNWVEEAQMRENPPSAATSQGARP